MRLIIITSTVKLQRGMKTSLLFVWIWWVLLESQNKLRRDEQKFIFILFSVFREFNKRSLRRRPGQKFHMVLIGWIFLPPCDVEAHSAASTLAQCCPHVVKLVNCMCRWNIMKTVFNQIFYIFKLTRTSIYQYITLIVTFSRNSSPKILKSGEVSSSTNHFWSFSVEQSCN